MATTQTDSFGMSPEFIAAQQAKANAAKTVSATAPTETANIGGTAPAPTPNAPIAQVASPQPSPSPTPTPVAETSTVTPTDSFGMSQDFIKQQQEKFKSPVVATPESPKIEPTKVETPKVETPKVETPKVDTNVSAGREKEIMSNLAEGAKNAPQLFKDRASFDAAYGYATADAGKKAILDSFYKQSNVQKGENQIFSELASNSFAGDKSTLEYKRAKQRIDNINQYRSFSDSDFSSAISNGTIALGTKTYNDLISIPEIKAKIDKAMSLNKINGETIKTDNVVNNAMKDIVADTTIGQAFNDGYISAEEMNKLTSTPEIIAKSKDVEEKKNSYDKMKAEYDDIDRAVDSELKGTGATSSYAAALKAERKEKLYKDLVVSMNVYNNAVGTLADMKKEAADLLSTNVGLYKDTQALERQKQLAQFQSDLSITTAQKKFEQDLKQQEQIASDPTTATNAILKQYADIGILPQRSSQEIISDIKAQVASGNPLAKALSELNQAFQSKTEYKNALAKKFAPEDTGWKLSNITTTDADGNQITKTVQYNEKTGQIRDVSGTGTGGVGTSATGQGLSVIPSGDFVDFTSSLKRTGNNVGQDTNNPGNIMAESEAGKNYARSLGAVGFYSSPNGRTYAVFPDMDTGKAAALSDLSTKLSGGSSWASGETTLGKFASGWTSGPNAAYNKNAAANYSRLTGFGENTRIKDIPQETLLNAIIANEGVNPNKSADVGASYVSTTPSIAKEFIGAIQRGDFTVDGNALPNAKTSEKTYTATQQGLLEKFLKDPSNKEVKKELKRQGLNEDDANKYNSSKSAFQSLSDNARIEIGKEKSAFRANPQVKAFEDALQSNRDIIVSINSGSGLGDTAAVFQFMKGLDPQSVVREGEFALAAGSAGLADKAKGYFTKLQSGEFLADESQRKEMARIVSAYLKNRAKTYDRLYDDMYTAAKAWGSPDEIIPKRASDELKSDETAIKSKSGITYSF